MYELDEKQKETLDKVISFIVNVYVPIFGRINLHPRVPDAPENMLFARDLMKDQGVPDKVRNVFLDHAERWLSPVNAPVVVHKLVPPVLLEDLKRIRTGSVDT